MDPVIFHLGATPVTQDQAILSFAVGVVVLLLVIFVALTRTVRARTRAEATAAANSSEMGQRVTELLKSQAEITGRMQTMAEIFSDRQADLNKVISDRLDNLGHRVNQSMGDSAKSTHDNLKRLHERLAVLDAAQRNINDLTGQVTNLSNILDNKQTRGAFGQGRMESIIADGMPKDGFQLQATLSNNARPDCLIGMPNDAPPLVVDAKFPLEGYSALKDAATPQERKAARQQFRGDVIKHVKDIKDRYLLPGETQDTAFMFVPSESVFAEIHEQFQDVIQRAYKARIIIVSPSLLMLSVQVIQAVLRDARLKQQAHIIHDEVMRLMEDIARLDDRVRKLDTHFGQVRKDIDQIMISTGKVASRGQRIEGLGFGESEAATSSEDTTAPRLVSNN